MNTKNLFWNLFTLSIILASSLCHFNCASREPLEILVYPPGYFVPGSETSLRVIVLEHKTGQPAEDAQVEIRLKSEKTGRQELLFKGKTGPSGSPHITFNVPTELSGDCELIAAANSELGSGKVSMPIPVTTDKGFKILLTSDKAVYRPGQTIHMRGLVFKKSRAAGGREVSIEVFEPSGYSVFNKKKKTCNYGIAEAGFTLGDEIITGNYTICFSIENIKKEKKVLVTEVPPPTSGMPPVPGSGAAKTAGENITLRTDKPVYNKGETPVLTVSSTQQQGYVYVDLLKENQIILTGEAKLEGGKTSLKLPIDAKHTGTLTCYARIPVPGQKAGDVTPVLAKQREIVVIPPEEEEESIELTFQSSKEKFSPGEEASIEIAARRKGSPCAAALGITVAGDSPGSVPILYSNPRLLTDKNGRASFTVRLDDVEPTPAPVTRWQVSALAHTLDGEMGSGTHNLPLRRGIRVEMDLPPQLTREDEVTIPVTVYNHQPSPQEVTLRLRKGDWFALTGQADRNITVGAHDKKVENFKIRAGASGDHKMILNTRDPVSGRDDTLTRTVKVIPLGKQVLHAVNFNLDGQGEISKKLSLPETAIKNTHKLKLKILPVFITQVSDGFQGMLRMPRGCFEQTSSFTYPNIMVLDYMQRTGQDKPAIREKAKKYISDGYQKLLQYEAKEGGFSFFKTAGYAHEIFSSVKGNARKILTAYGLMLFADMEKVYQIDRAIIPRIQNWLISQMTGNHWEPDSHFGAASSARDNDFAATAYITWALLHSGLDKNNKGIKKAIAYQEKNHTSYKDNPNALSYCALSLVKAGKNAAPVLQRLNQLVKNDGNGTYWTPAGYITGGFATASVANIETTAIAALANLEAGNASFDILKIIRYLLKNKSALGNWGSTQATVLTLKVLIETLPRWSKPVSGMAQVWMDNNLVKEINFTEENNKIKQEVDLKDFLHPGTPEFRIKYRLNGELFCQLLSSYYIRWDDPLASKSPINLSLIYNTKRLNKGETVRVDATASYVETGNVPFAIVDIGIPPGFEVNPGDFMRLRAKGIIDRYEIDRGRVILYFSNLGQKGFRFGMKAVTKGRVMMPEARIYDYYNPQVIHVAKPVELTVI